MGTWTRLALVVASVAVAAAAAGCARDAAGEDPEEPSRSGAAQPYPYARPAPPAEPSPVDGAYERELTPADAGPVGKCTRCPPYRLIAGPQRLVLEEGVYGVSDAGEVERVGHFVVRGDELELFNDANCPYTRGVYRWERNGDELTLEEIDDPCAFDRVRARYLTIRPWTAASG